MRWRVAPLSTHQHWWWKKKNLTHRDRDKKKIAIKHCVRCVPREWWFLFAYILWHIKCTNMVNEKRKKNTPTPWRSFTLGVLGKLIFLFFPRKKKKKLGNMKYHQCICIIVWRNLWHIFWGKNYYSVDKRKQQGFVFFDNHKKIKIY